LRLQRVSLSNDGTQAVLRARAGNAVLLEAVTCVPAVASPYQLEEIGQILD